MSSCNIFLVSSTSCNFSTPSISLATPLRYIWFSEIKKSYWQLRCHSWCQIKPLYSKQAIFRNTAVITQIQKFSNTVANSYHVWRFKKFRITKYGASTSRCELDMKSIKKLSNFETVGNLNVNFIRTNCLNSFQQ